MKSLIGRTRVIGPTRRYSVPIPLDPAPYEGAIVLGEDNFMYYSDGVSWVNLGASGAQGAQGAQGSAYRDWRRKKILR